MTPELIGWANKATVAEAKRSFDAGMTVVVCDCPQGNEIEVWTDSVVHTRQSITWEGLVEKVEMWRKRLPQQTYYVLRTWAAGKYPTQPEV